MKFRDPKTGEVFETIRIARNKYCIGKDCLFNCKLGQKSIETNDCIKFCEEHPSEAANLMGYEVIGCDACANVGRPLYMGPCSECHDYSKFEPKEDSMEKKNKPLSEWTLKEARDHCTKYWKEHGCDGCLFRCADGGCAIEAPSEWEIPSEPSSVAEDTDAPCKPAKTRLAEVLGVDVGERFTMRDGNIELPGLYVEKDGTMYERDGTCASGGIYSFLINHPESIIRAPRLTEAELAIMRATGARWVSMDDIEWGVEVAIWAERPMSVNGFYYGKEDDKNFRWLGNIAKSLFSSVHPGDCIEMEVTGE